MESVFTQPIAPAIVSEAKPTVTGEARVATGIVAARSANAGLSSVDLQPIGRFND